MGQASPERAPDVEPGHVRPDLVDARPGAAVPAELQRLDGRAAHRPGSAPLRAATVQRLQGHAGNAAVAAMLQRRARPTPIAPRQAAASAPTRSSGSIVAKEGGVGAALVTEQASSLALPSRGTGFAGAGSPGDDGLPIQRSLASIIEEARRKAAPPAGPDDTKSVEGDTDLSEYTDAPAKAAEERKAIPPPPPPPVPTTPAIVTAKEAPKVPPKPPKKKVGKANAAAPKPKPKPGAAGAKGAPSPGELVLKPAPPLPPAHVKPKKAGAVIPPPPLAPKPGKPGQDPAFTKVVTAAKMTVKKAQKHPTGKKESEAAQGAALAPSNDIEYQAKANRADTMATAKPKPFDENAFVAAVEEAMRKSAPKNLSEAGDVDDKAGGVKDVIGSKVAAGKEKAGGEVEAKSQQPPDPSTATPKPVTPMNPLEVEQPTGMKASGAMPAPAPNEQVDFRHGPAKVDNEMVDAGVTEEQLAQSNEPEFTGALDAKKEGEAHAATAPAQVRKAEAQILKQAASASAAEEKQTVGAAKGSIGDAVSKISGEKASTKSKDETKRKEVADHITSLFDKTKLEVEGILSGLETTVDQMFTDGEAAIRKSFTDDWNKRLNAYKDDRYSGLRGKYRWVRDKFKGLPDSANRLFEQSKAIYERDMQKLVRQIAKTVSAELNRATVRIEQGRGEVAAYVGTLKGDLAKFGQEAATDMAEKFDTLDSSVKEKFDDLAGSLAKKYQESQKAVAEEIEAAQEANKGLIDKAIGAVKGVIRVISQLKDLILNVLSRIASVIGDIIASPITFLKNFVNAVKSGITRFMDNIGDHLQKGLMGWLFGTLDAKGIEIPDSFSVEGILKLVMSVLGMTWTFVREKIAKKIGEPAMAALESGADIVKQVITGGPAVLGKMLLEKFGDFEDMVVGEIKNFVMEKVVKSGITFLISLLNPAAAFIKACKMIYDVVMFFVERGSQIREFVETLIDAAADIAKGGSGGIAEKIEGVLARLLPLAISFLANILGLGGVGDKIRSIIDKVRNPIHRAMDKVIDVVVKMTAPIWKPAKALFEKGKKLYGKAKAKVVGMYEKGKEKVKAGYERGKAAVKGAYAKGKAKVSAGAAKVKEKIFSLLPQKKATTMNGAAHTISAVPNKKGRFSISMASKTPEILSVKITRTIAQLEERAASETGKQKQQTLTQINELVHINQTAKLLEEVNPEGKKVTHMGAPEGFEKEMRELSDKVKQFGDKHDLKDIAPGTVVDLRMLAKFGLPLPSFLQAQEVADEEGAAIDIRPTTVGAPELLAAGLAPKPEELKQKTMSKEDELLGVPPEYRDRVVWFLPSRPKPENFKDHPPEVLRAVWARWRQRKDEYYANVTKMKAHLRDNQMAVRKVGGATSGGMVTGGSKAIKDLVEGVGITGDHDIYEVHGNPEPVIKKLREAPFRVQHGAHLDWPATVRKAEGRDLTDAEWRIFDSIVAKHLQKKEALLRVNPKAPPTTANSSEIHFRSGGGATGGEALDVVDTKEPGTPGLAEPAAAGADKPATGIAAIWAKAEQIARAKTKQPLPDTKALGGLTRELETVLKPEGVKSVGAKPSTSQPGKHKIVAQRSEQTLVDNVQAGESAVEPDKPLSLDMSPEEFKASPAAQQALFAMAKEARERQEKFANSVIADVGADGGKVKSILKRDDLKEFVDGIVDKCHRNKYTKIGQMDDIVRGRFNLANGKQVEDVAKALEAQSQFTVKEVVKPRREVAGVGHGYPRYHVIVRDTSGLTHEWQVGTAAVSKVYETMGITIPSTMELKVGMKNDIHDIEYDVLKGVEKKFPEFAASVGIPSFRAKVDHVSAEAGTLGDAMPNIEAKIKALHDECSIVLKRVIDAKGGDFVKQFYH